MFTFFAAVGMKFALDCFFFWKNLRGILVLVWTKWRAILGFIYIALRKIFLVVWCFLVLICLICFAKLIFCFNKLRTPQISWTNQGKHFNQNQKSCVNFITTAQKATKNTTAESANTPFTKIASPNPKRQTPNTKPLTLDLIFPTSSWYTRIARHIFSKVGVVEFSRHIFFKIGIFQNWYSQIS